MTRFTAEEIEQCKREMAALWDVDGTWRGTPVRDEFMNRELFISYAAGVKLGTIRHVGPLA